MKQYRNYTSSSNKLRWKFFKDFKYPSMKAMEKDEHVDRGDIHIAYIGFCNKMDFINTVSELDQSSKNWVKERVSNTGNGKDIITCNKNPGHIVVYLYSPAYGNNARKDIIEQGTIIEKIQIMPVQIEAGEWWYKGCFIQEQEHPQLLKYCVFKDNKSHTLVDDCGTFTEAAILCEENEVKKFDQGWESFLGVSKK